MNAAVSFETAARELLQTNLEGYLRVDLQNAAVQRHTEERAVGVGVGPDGRENIPKEAAGNAIDWKVEVLVVENIEGGCSHGKSKALADFEVLQDRQIGIEEPGSAKRV